MVVALTVEVYEFKKKFLIKKMADNNIIGHEQGNNAHSASTFETLHAKDARIGAMEKTIKFLTLENELKDKTIRVMELENEMREKKNEIEKLKLEVKITTKQKTINEFFIDKDILLPKDIAKFFWKEETPNDLSTVYSEWFQCMDDRMDKNTPIMHEEYVLVKLECDKSGSDFAIYSDQRDLFFTNRPELNIFNKGWCHDTASGYILHPNDINKSIEMDLRAKFEVKEKEKYHGWDVKVIPKEHRMEYNLFIILFLKNK